MKQGPAVGLGEPERAKGASGRVDALGTPPQPGEYVLDDLFGQPADRQHPEGDVEQAAPVAPVELGECLLVVPLDRHRQEGHRLRVRCQSCRLAESAG